MANGARRDLTKESFWRRQVQGQANSGSSIRAWCRQRGISEANFHWWRTELARRAGEKSRTTFMPVSVAEDEKTSDGGRIEIELADQRRVRIVGRVDRQMLADVLAVMAFGSEAQTRREARSC